MKKLITIITVLGLFTGIRAFGQDMNANFEPYMKNMQRNIKLNWEPPKCNENKRVIITYSIFKNGKLKNVSVTKSSNNKELDTSALKAIKKTKFSPLPTEFDKDYIEIQFTFDYNAKND